MTDGPVPPRGAPATPAPAKGAAEPGAEPLAGLAAAVGGLAARGPAPVHLWNPPHRGDVGLAIADDGTWLYRGSTIERPAMVRLFASILRRDPNGFKLVTPVESVDVAVADAPFVAVAMARRDDVLTFVTNLGDTVEAGRDHPLRFAVSVDGGVKPYVLVRDALWARLTRSLAIELVGLAEEIDGEIDGRLAVRSGGTVFPLEEP